VNPAGLAETHGGPENGGTSKMQFAGFKHNRLVKGLVMPSGGFSDEDAEQNAVVGNFHDSAFQVVEIERNRVTEPDGAETRNQGHDSITTCLRPFAVIGQCKRLQTERGKRRIAAANAGHEKLPRSRADKHASLWSGERREKADGKRSRDVNDQRAPRKRPAEPIRDQSRNEKPRAPAERTAGHDPKVELHDDSKSPVGVISTG